MPPYCPRSSNKPEVIIGTQQVVMRLNNSRELQEKVLGHETESQDTENHMKSMSKNKNRRSDSKVKEPPATCKVDLFALLD